MDGCLCHLLRLLTFLNCFCGENVSVLVFFFICFLSFFFKPSPSYRSLVSCRSSCTEGTLRTSKKQEDAKCSSGRRCKEGTKRKEIVVLCLMKEWKMEQPCLPAVMTVIVSKWLPAGRRGHQNFVQVRDGLYRTEPLLWNNFS